uniref:Uncharacterized protein n=1 Tax=Meloidogyne hapla TaxID=6305 RepID=A0A1I8BAN4_MELHA
MYLKLIFYLLFLLIFINISIGKKCECSENEKKNVFQHRYKRGLGSCSCFGGGNKRKDKASESSSNRGHLHHEEHEEHHEEHHFSDFPGTVFISFGTEHISGGLIKQDFRNMFELFSTYTDYQFNVRVETKDLEIHTENIYAKNIKFDQQALLCEYYKLSLNL